jgi:hypothetical protein
LSHSPTSGLPSELQGDNCFVRSCCGTCTILIVPVVSSVVARRLGASSLSKRVKEKSCRFYHTPIEMLSLFYSRVFVYCTLSKAMGASALKYPTASLPQINAYMLPNARVPKKRRELGCVRSSIFMPCKLCCTFHCVHNFCKQLQSSCPLSLDSVHHRDGHL